MPPLVSNKLSSQGLCWPGHGGLAACKLNARGTSATQGQTARTGHICPGWLRGTSLWLQVSPAGRSGWLILLRLYFPSLSGGGTVAARRPGKRIGAVLVEKAARRVVRYDPRPGKMSTSAYIALHPLFSDLRALLARRMDAG